MWLRNDNTLKCIKVIKTKMPKSLLERRLWDYPYIISVTPHVTSRIYVWTRVIGGSFFYFSANGRWWKGRIEPDTPSGHTYDVCLNELLRENRKGTYSLVARVS